MINGLRRGFTYWKIAFEFYQFLGLRNVLKTICFMNRTFSTRMVSMMVKNWVFFQGWKSNIANDVYQTFCVILNTKTKHDKRGM